MYWVTNPGNESERRVGRFCGWKAWGRSVRTYVNTPMRGTWRLPRTLGQLQNRFVLSTEDSIFQGLGRRLHPWHRTRDNPPKERINEFTSIGKMYFIVISATCENTWDSSSCHPAFICNPGLQQTLVFPRSVWILGRVRLPHLLLTLAKQK